MNGGICYNNHQLFMVFMCIFTGGREPLNRDQCTVESCIPANLDNSKVSLVSKVQLYSINFLVFFGVLCCFLRINFYGFVFTKKRKRRKKTYIHVAKLQDQQQETPKRQKKNTIEQQNTTQNNSYFHRQAQFTICI